jgi:hypothetical protein
MTSPVGEGIRYLSKRVSPWVNSTLDPKHWSLIKKSKCLGLARKTHMISTR